MSGKLTELRLVKELKAYDMVETVQELYPKFDKSLLSKCENGEVYGVQMKQKAIKHLYKRYAPETHENAPKTNDRARGYQIRCRISDSDRRALQRALMQNHTTIQSWMYAIIKNFIGEKNVNMSDHPDISCAERTGYAPWQAERQPVCMVCGESCETIYKDKWGNFAGCDECISFTDAWEVSECFPERNDR